MCAIPHYYRQQSTSPTATHAHARTHTRPRTPAGLLRLPSSPCLAPLQLEEARRATGSVDSQFRALYHDKYLPLKGAAGTLRAELADAQKRLVAEEL